MDVVLMRIIDVVLIVVGFLLGRSGKVSAVVPPIKLPLVDDLPEPISPYKEAQKNKRERVR